MIDESGTALERFVTTGIDDEQRALIGDLPRGRGILGALIREARTLRLTNLSEDPRSVGFPPGHPPMTTFLGVPVMLRGVAYGNLYLTEKQAGAPFTEEDAVVERLLAAQAAVAIENARLYESATRWSRQLESLHEVVRSLVEEMELEHLLELVCARLRELVGARLALIVLPAPREATELVVAAADGDDITGAHRDPASPAGGSKVGRVLRPSPERTGRLAARGSRGRSGRGPGDWALERVSTCR